VAVDIGLIGCGAATERYYVPALKKFGDKIGNLYLVDTNAARAETVVRAVGKGKICEDYRRIMDRINGAIIVVPHFLHYQIALELLHAGVGVLCEKPLAEKSQQAREMVTAAEANNVSLCVNNTRRMFPNFQKARELISQGRIGKLRSIEYIEGSTFGWASATGFYVDPKMSSKGILLDLGPHVADTICWWLGHKPELSSFEDDSFGGPESTVRIQAQADGCNVSIFLDRLVDLDSRFRIVGESGTIEGKPMDWKHLGVHYSEGKAEELKLSLVYRNYPAFVLPVFENFLRVLQGDAEPLVPGSDVLDSIELIDECYSNRRRFFLSGYSDLPVRPKSGGGTLLVTGASGFIGGRVVEMLHLTGERKVRACINRWSSAARIGRFPVDIVRMNLMEPEAIAAALDGVTEIIHCAKGDEQVTVKGTRNLLEAARRKGIRRFVHMSTTEVYGNVSGTVDEDAPYQYTGNAYNRSKIEAEKVCWEYSQKGLPVSSLRPSIVYGPFSRNWSLHFANMLLQHKWGIYEGIGEGNCNLVYVDEVVNAILAALDSDQAVGEAFNIVGPEVVSWNEYFRRFNDSLGLPPLNTIGTAKASMRTAMMKPVRMLGGLVRDHFMGPVKMIAERCETVDTLLRKTERTLKATPHPDDLRLYSRPAVFSTRKAERIIGFSPSVSVDEGLRRTTSWLSQQGFRFTRTNA
jgi:predicted dehydrogenase/nucleoside-diphosphate-sugar epimerase